MVVGASGKKRLVLGGWNRCAVLMVLFVALVEGVAMDEKGLELVSERQEVNTHAQQEQDLGNLVGAVDETENFNVNIGFFASASEPQEARVILNVDATAEGIEYVRVDFRRTDIQSPRFVLAPRPYLVATERGSEEPEPIRDDSTQYLQFTKFQSADPPLREDLEGFWTEKFYQYLILEGGKEWTIYLYNMNPQRDDQENLTGTLEVGFLSGSKPCPRGEELQGVCSERGTCTSEGVCECNSNDSEYFAGRFCEERVVRMTDLKFRSELTVETDETLHFSYDVDCQLEDGEECYTLLSRSLPYPTRGSGAYFTTTRKVQGEHCENPQGIQTQVNEIYLLGQNQIDRFNEDTELLSCGRKGFGRVNQGQRVILSVINMMDFPIQDVGAEMFPCGGTSNQSCDQVDASFYRVAILIIVPFAVVVLALAIPWYRIRRGRSDAPSNRNSPGLSKREINRIMPAYAYPGDAPPGEMEAQSCDEQCTVCLCEYETGELVRRLPCNHVYHKNCLDKWMVKYANCPTCRSPVEEDKAEKKRFWGRITGRFRRRSEHLDDFESQGSSEEDFDVDQAGLQESNTIISDMESADGGDPGWNATVTTSSQR
ncbi:hypothetical protein NDN08_000018 [Rhodosorus marinus]|uniref:RING-type domain-containing protein n=1 Tax=Rhodosorus marinus TaxID=101924 RepID=A0AAV8UHE6_9RHOD|nr:hypothetical protein NDN08_000018 [Rhodosorus marinus]